MFIYGMQDRSDLSSPFQVSRYNVIPAVKHSIELLTSLIQTPVPYTKRCKKHLLTGKSKCPPSGRRDQTLTSITPSISNIFSCFHLHIASTNAQNNVWAILGSNFLFYRTRYPFEVKRTVCQMNYSTHSIYMFKAVLYMVYINASADFFS